MYWPGHSNAQPADQLASRSKPTIFHSPLRPNAAVGLHRDSVLRAHLSRARSRKPFDCPRNPQADRSDPDEEDEDVEDLYGPSSATETECQDEGLADQGTGDEDADISTTTNSSQSREQPGWTVPRSRRPFQATVSTCQTAPVLSAIKNHSYKIVNRSSGCPPPDPLSHGTSTNNSNNPSSNHQILLGVRIPFSLVAGATTTTHPPPSAGRAPVSRSTGQSNPIFTQSVFVTQTPPAGLASEKTTTPNSIIIISKNPERLPDRSQQSSTDVICTSKQDVCVDSTIHELDNDNAPSTVRRSLRRPKVAFVVPPEPITSNGSEQTPESTPQLLGATSPLCENVGDPKTSPSARFPGWGVITDDEEDEEVEKKQATPDSVTQTAIEPTSSATNQSVIDGDSANPQSKPESEIQCQPTESSSAVTSKPINVKFKEPQFIMPKVMTSNASDRQRFREQQEYFRQRDPSSVTLAKSASMLRQPRKSLAMIFSNLSSNLGFTGSTTHPKTGSLSSATSSDSLRLESIGAGGAGGARTSGSSPQINNANLIDLAGSKLIRDQRGHSTLIQLGKDQSLDQAFPYMNGDVGRRGRISLLSNVIPSNPSRSNADPVPSSLSQPQSRGHFNPDTTADRSLIVDLLCCTCCTQVDEEADYSNLIENHRLARFITMAAILTILGLILAYIIRSAIEVPAQADQPGAQTPLATSPSPVYTPTARIPLVQLSQWTSSASDIISSGGGGDGGNDGGAIVNEITTNPM